MQLRELQVLCEAAIPQEGGRFHMPRLMTDVYNVAGLSDLIPDLFTIHPEIGNAVRSKLSPSIVRQAFFIESVVLPGVTTTRYKTRWSLDDGDPRFSSPSECISVANKIVYLLRQLIDTNGGPEMLESLIDHRMVPFELPIDYDSREEPIHRAGNIRLVELGLLREVSGLRLLLLDDANPHQAQFERIYRNKIAIKTYLTDRAQTGAHMTNREKRWEAHPDSVQFARRESCLGIEFVLVNTLCFFANFPLELRKVLDASALLEPPELQPTRCPVTLQPLSFGEFVDEVMAPTQGVSRFQVGHLNPLKLEGNTWSDGHSPGNIGWLSSDGNRIQGSYSVTGTREMLARIWLAYREAGLLPRD